ncbi:MAG: hypothetical protein ACJ712_02735 [Nitrososphaeraceae archaeon]
MLAKNINNVKEDKNIDRLLLDSKHRESVNTLIEANANIITAANANDNERSEKVSWWTSELDLLGNKKSSDITKKDKPNGIQEFENLADNIKQIFIRDYKACYSD